MDQKTNEKYKAANGTIDKTVPGATNPPAPEKPELVAPTPSLQGAHRQEHLAAPHLLPGSQPLCPPSAGKPDPSPTAALITTVVLVPLSVPLTPRAPSVSHLCMSSATQGLSHGRGSFILEQTKHKSNRLTHRARENCRTRPTASIQVSGRVGSLSQRTCPSYVLETERWCPHPAACHLDPD